MALVDDMFANAKKLLAAGQNDKARVVIDQILRVRTDHVPAIVLLGCIESQAGNRERAHQLFERAVQLDPSNANARFNVGVSLAAEQRFTEAETQYRESIRLVPRMADTHYNLGCTLRSLNRLDEAIEPLWTAIRLAPQMSAAYYYLADALRDQGRVPEALDLFRRADALHQGGRSIQALRLSALNYVPLDPAHVFQEHKQYADGLIAAAPKLPSFSNTRDPSRVVRVGLLSADLRQHSCSYFLEPLISKLDPERFELTAYHQHTREDAVTERLRPFFKRWRPIPYTSTLEVCEMIRADEIDVLIDCSGHTGHARLDVMAAKPAPVQGTYLGYPNTTGLSTIDFRLVDSNSDPVGMTDPFYTERLVRLDPCAWCYRPDARAPEVSALPALHKKHFTFGSYNNLSKYSDVVVQLWSEVLKRVPDAVLRLKNQWIGDPGTRAKVLARFEAAGVDPARIEAAPYTNGVKEHLEQYAEIDLQLDTFPYHGTTTTCESFWQGVPVITLTGRVHASRVSTSLLRAVGLPELAVNTPEEFVETAARLANDLDKLSNIRASLRAMMERSPLRDEKAFAQRFGEMLSSEFARWCRA